MGDAPVLACRLFTLGRSYKRSSDRTSNCDNPRFSHSFLVCAFAWASFTVNRWAYCSLMVYLDTVQVSCLKIGRTSRSSTRKSSRTSFWPVGSHCLSLFCISLGALGCFRAFSASTAIVLTSEKQLGGLFWLLDLVILNCLHVLFFRWGSRPCKNESAIVNQILTGSLSIGKPWLQSLWKTRKRHFAIVNILWRTSIASNAKSRRRQRQSQLPYAAFSYRYSRINNFNKKNFFY